MRWNISEQAPAPVQIELPSRIVVTGDTHLGARRDWLPDRLVAQLRRADLILHTGDFATPGARELFEFYAPVYAVAGNNDPASMNLPERLAFVAGSTRIVLTHGHLERGPTAKQSVIKSYAGDVDLVIYGHSHRAHWEEVDGTWFLNPGSPTMKRWEPQFSFAVIEFDQRGDFQVEFEYFDKQARSDSEWSGQRDC